MEQGKVIISKSNNITCIAGRTYCGKTTHLIEELTSHINVDGKVQPFVLVSPELKEERMVKFMSKPENRMKGFYVSSEKTEQSMNEIFDDCIKLMRNTGIKVMAFDNIPRNNAMDVVQLYNKLKEEKDLYFIFSHHIVVDLAEKIEEREQQRIADIKWNMV